MTIHCFMPLILYMTIYLMIMAMIVHTKKDMSIANFTWGGGCILIALYTFLLNGIYETRHLILTTMIVLWAGRLAMYVYLRYKGSDPRFTTWKNTELLHYIGYIFGLQTVLMLIMSTPIFIINLSVGGPLQYLDFIGIALWLIGYSIESVSDYRLFQFTKNPANHGRVMQYGLWHYSRHPNYFGEIVMWWGIFLIALAVPYGIYAIIAPATITFLLIFVTGIPWIEKSMEHNPEYQEYKRRTSMLIPWFPKK